MCRSRLWPKPPSRPTGRWRWRCAAAIFAKASPALRKSARRGLRGNERGAWARLRPAGYAAAVFATKGLAEPKRAQPAKAGGARRDRTADLVIANDALSQLSYGPLCGRLDVRDGGQQSAPFTIRAKVKSRTAK